MPSLTAWGGPITVPPGLQPGDKYRLVFVTSTTTDGTSSNIGYYNAFVSDVAAASSLSSLGTTWTAVGSTASVNAEDNTGTNPSAGVGYPVYDLAGHLVAANNTALSTSPEYPYPIVAYTETGDFLQTQVWTWYGRLGGIADTSYPLGSSFGYSVVGHQPQI